MNEFDRHVKKVLGRRIRRRRRQFELSQEALAERADVHRTQIPSSSRAYGCRSPRRW